MATIPEDLYERLRSEGHISDEEHQSLHGENDDDEEVTGATQEFAPAPTNEATSKDVQEVEAVRAGLLARAAEFESKGDHRNAAILKSQAAHAADSSLSAPVPVATAPVAGSGATPIAEQIATAEEAGQWQQAMALKTQQLLSGVEA